MSFIALIPARTASTRLPDKPLADIAGKPMVVRTAERAARSGAAQVCIATDDARVLQAAQAHGVRALMTRGDHSTGTDRLAEAVAQLGLPDDAIVVNAGRRAADRAGTDRRRRREAASQPRRRHRHLRLPAGRRPGPVQSGTWSSWSAPRRIAPCISRAPIPWARDALAGGERVLADGLPALHHIGLYAYRVSFLRRFPTLPQGVLERFESLEQLRAMEHGHAIVVHRASTPPAAGVTRPPTWSACA